ncbi:MAG: type II secretion system protein [Verrucomicrobiae bacterium]|nr:type II secretion system protein [Verrucomicrobiae bacterium]
MKSSLLNLIKPRGMTLIEVTLVISILLALTSALFLGVTAYKRGADRANCIQNIASVQKAVRSYGNLAGKRPGDTIPNLKDEIIGFNKLVPLEPSCPGGGLYNYSGNTLPLPNHLYLDCDLPTHEPKTSRGW